MRKVLPLLIVFSTSVVVADEQSANEAVLRASQELGDVTATATAIQSNWQLWVAYLDTLFVETLNDPLDHDTVVSAILFQDHHEATTWINPCNIYLNAAAFEVAQAIVFLNLSQWDSAESQANTAIEHLNVAKTGFVALYFALVSIKNSTGPLGPKYGVTVPPLPEMPPLPPLP